jgi:long-chain acyl-CoA synthetase
MAREPWHSLYDEGLPAEIPLEHGSALEMFLSAVDRAGDQDLVRYFETPLTVTRVHELSGALAVGLDALGVARGDRVALYMQNVPQFVIGLLAAWKLGAIAVPCNPMLLGRELTSQLQDSGAVAIVTLESLHRDVVQEILPDTALRTVVTTSELDLLEEAPPRPLSAVRRERQPGTHDLLELAAEYEGLQPNSPKLRPEDVAVLTYTSGTTGPPKGAMNTHANLVFNSQAFRAWAHLGRNDVILGIAPLFHITGLVTHIGIGLCVPAPIVLAYRFDAAETCRLIERHRATVTVAAITAFLALMKDDALDRHDLSSLTKAFSGGAPIPLAAVQSFERRTGVVIRGAYGLTETTGPTHLTPLGQRVTVDPERGAAAVGVPIFNTSTRIIDADGIELPRRELGEVALSGPQVVPGYWNKPDETAHALRGGELRTGDVGFVDDAGCLYIVDRTKDMIVASGYKVWPGEVEEVLYQHGAVHEAAVVGVPDPYRGETVQAFVSLRPDQRVDVTELVQFCRERMAAYKYPRVVEVLDELPKTASGKILRRELRERARGSGRGF